MELALGLARPEEQQGRERTKRGDHGVKVAVEFAGERPLSTVVGGNLARLIGAVHRPVTAPFEMFLDLGQDFMTVLAVGAQNHHDRPAMIDPNTRFVRHRSSLVL